MQNLEKLAGSKILELIPSQYTEDNVKPIIEKLEETNNNWSLHVVGVQGGNNMDIRYKNKDHIKEQLIDMIILHKMYYYAFGYEKYFQNFIDGLRVLHLIDWDLKPVITNETEFREFLEEHLQIADRDYCLNVYGDGYGITYIISRHHDYIIDKLHHVIRYKVSR